MRLVCNLFDLICQTNVILHWCEMLGDGGVQLTLQPHQILLVLCACLNAGHCYVTLNSYIKCIQLMVMDIGHCIRLPSASQNSSAKLVHHPAIVQSHLCEMLVHCSLLLRMVVAAISKLPVSL